MVDDFKDINGAFIPFGVDDAITFSATTRGVDIGIVALRPYYAVSLQANRSLRFAALDLNETVDIESPDGYFVVGSPAEAFQVSESHGGRILDCKARRFAVPIEIVNAAECREGTDPRFWENPNDLFGRVAWGPETVCDMRGMSGSPVFAFQLLGDKIRVKLVGVQSAWLADSRIVRVISLKDLFELVRNDLKIEAQ